MKMETSSEQIGVIYGVGSTILAVQVINEKPKVVDGEIDNIDLTTNTMTIKDRQSGLKNDVNIANIKSIELTEELINNSFALFRPRKTSIDRDLFEYIVRTSMIINCDVITGMDEFYKNVPNYPFLIDAHGKSQKALIVCYPQKTTDNC